MVSLFCFVFVRTDAVYILFLAMTVILSTSDRPNVTLIHV